MKKAGEEFVNSSAPSRRLLQGVHFCVLELDEALRHIESWTQAGSPTYIAIANAHTLNLARALPTYRELLKRFVVLNDGIGVDIASRLRHGQRFPANLNGTDLVPSLLAHATRPLRIYMLGARPEVVAQAYARAQVRYPRHVWLGFSDGYFQQDDETALCDRIRAMQPDVLLVAMGNPLQEVWIERCGAATGAGVSIGVGALFDFWAGSATRAPALLRRLKLEWVYRLLQEPRRLWRRYLVGTTLFLWAALKEFKWIRAG